MKKQLALTAVVGTLFASLASGGEESSVPLSVFYGSVRVGVDGSGVVAVAIDGDNDGLVGDYFLFTDDDTGLNPWQEDFEYAKVVFRGACLTVSGRGEHPRTLVTLAVRGMGTSAPCSDEAELIENSLGQQLLRVSRKRDPFPMAMFTFDESESWNAEVWRGFLVVDDSDLVDPAVCQAGGHGASGSSVGCHDGDYSAFCEPMMFSCCNCGGLLETDGGACGCVVSAEHGWRSAQVP